MVLGWYFFETFLRRRNLKFKLVSDFLTLFDIFQVVNSLMCCFKRYAFIYLFGFYWADFGRSHTKFQLPLGIFPKRFSSNGSWKLSLLMCLSFWGSFASNPTFWDIASQLKLILDHLDRKTRIHKIFNFCWVDESFRRLFSEDRSWKFYFFRKFPSAFGLLLAASPKKSLFTKA